ncbi:MAG: prepilin-type N-terminal cleavage/methylation domain-containing protein [Pseudomonadota bacterium]
MAHHDFKRSTGFTLIELILVLVVLGLVAAVALPRFYDLEADARAAKVDGLVEAVRTAASDAHKAAVSGGQDKAAAATLMLGKATVELAHGYPAGNAAGILRAARIRPERTDVRIDAPLPGTLVIEVLGGHAGRCTVTYTQAAAAHRQPIISADKSAC